MLGAVVVYDPQRREEDALGGVTPSTADKCSLVQVRLGPEKGFVYQLQDLVERFVWEGSIVDMAERAEEDSGS